MVIFTYSNILLSVSMINITNGRVAFAAMNGHLDCLKYLHETAKAPWNYLAVRDANKNNHTECLQYLLDNDCPLPKPVGLMKEEYYTLPIPTTTIMMLPTMNIQVRFRHANVVTNGELKKKLVILLHA